MMDMHIRRGTGSAVMIVSDELRRLFVVGAVAGMLATAAHAGPPRERLTLPLYTFDSTSPTVLDGSVSPDSILRRTNSEVPAVRLSADLLDLGRSGDEIDALSSNLLGVAQQGNFSILFSVDRATIGAATPASTLIVDGVPFNVQDQASKGHAACDLFISLDLFSLNPGQTASVQGGGSNNSEVGNQYDEGGTSFNGKPPLSSSGAATPALSVAGQVPQDNLNAAGGTGLPSTGVQPGRDLYFSLRRGSASIPILAPTDIASGAIIFYAPDPEGGLASRVFATPTDLGLDVLDDIDAVAVIDGDGDGAYDAGPGSPDAVLFSLSPDSPSLSTIPGASEDAPAADVFLARPGFQTARFAPASIFGLGAAPDNIDALDLVPCGDARDCALRFGIRDDSIPTVSQWGVGAMSLALLVMATVLLRRAGATSIA